MARRIQRPIQNIKPRRGSPLKTEEVRGRSRRAHSLRFRTPTHFSAFNRSHHIQIRVCANAMSERLAHRPIFWLVWFQRLPETPPRVVGRSVPRAYLPSGDERSLYSSSGYCECFEGPISPNVLGKKVHQRPRGPVHVYFYNFEIGVVVCNHSRHASAIILLPSRFP